MNHKKKLLLFLCSVISLGFLTYPVLFITSSCATTGNQSEKPLFTDLYSFARYDIPSAKKPGSINLTAVIITPEYKDTYNQEYAGGAKVTAGGVMSTDMLKVFKSFAGTVGEDIEAQLVAKGMTTKGPYALSEVTYPDKKGADLTVSTNVVLDIQYGNPRYLRQASYSDGGAYIYSNTMTVGTKVYFYMLEPMSEEKMWIKKLDLGVEDYTYEYGLMIESYAAGSDGCGGQVYSTRPTNTLSWDQRPKIFSDILKRNYPKVMKAAWTYMDTNEMVNLKSKSQEIRERKRY